MMGLDVGPFTLKQIRDICFNARTIIWNGPFGLFENDNFAKGTALLATIITEATKNGAYSVAGGGDTLAAINKFRIQGFSYVSTAGGAMLEYMEGKALPGIEALQTTG